MNEHRPDPSDGVELKSQAARSLSRRHAMRAVAVAGIGVPILTACGAEGPGSSAGGSGGVAEGTGGDVFAATTDVPVGGCVVYDEGARVVTQPTEGVFKCFTGTCTHQGCPLKTSADGVIPCPCHGSEFSLTDGSVLRGPATQPLSPIKIVVDGENIALA